MLSDFIYDIVIIFGSALAVIILCQRLRLPAVIGFLLTGIVVGPYGLGFIREPGNVEIFAELGVVFLLFTIGLELSIKRMKSLGRYFLLGGGIQTGLTILISISMAKVLGISWNRAFYFGLVLALSSTAIVLKMYSDRQELHTPHGEVSMGILLFQDFMIVPFMLVVPLLSGKVESETGNLVGRFLLGLAGLFIAFFISRTLLPKFLRFIVHTRIREILVICGLFLCLGAALVTEKLGFSLALGAFLAGILIAESDYFHQIIAEASPFRDVFNSLFFISVGMLIKVDFALDRPGAVLLLFFLVLVLKGGAVFLSVLLLSLPVRTAFLTAIGLFQIGEFSFILLQLGIRHSIVPEGQYQLLISAAFLSMLFTPILIGLGPRIFTRHVGKKSPAKKEIGKDAQAPQVVIIGFGLAGRHLAGVLKAAMIPYRIIELNGAIVQQAKTASEPILYGDATRTRILEKGGIASAHICVWVIWDKAAIHNSIQAARQINPGLFMVVRSRGFSDIAELLRLGADEVVSEEFETSIEIFTTVLARLHVPGNVIRSQTRLLREDGYRMLRLPSPRSGLNDKIALALSKGTTDTFLLLPDNSACGKTLVELNLRARSGTLIIAVIRDEKSITNPPGDLVIKEGDIFVLVGNHAQVDKAFEILEDKKG